MFSERLNIQSCKFFFLIKITCDHCWSLKKLSIYGYFVQRLKYYMYNVVPLLRLFLVLKKKSSFQHNLFLKRYNSQFVMYTTVCIGYLTPSRAEKWG